MVKLVVQNMQKTVNVRQKRSKITTVFYGNTPIKPLNVLRPLHHMVKFSKLLYSLVTLKLKKSPCLRINTPLLNRNSGRNNSVTPNI